MFVFLYHLLPENLDQKLDLKTKVIKVLVINLKQTATSVALLKKLGPRTSVLRNHSCH